MIDWNQHNSPAPNCAHPVTGDPCRLGPVSLLLSRTQAGWSSPTVVLVLAAMERVKAGLARVKLGVWLKLVRGAAWKYSVGSAPMASNACLLLVWGGLSAELSQSRLALGGMLWLPPPWECVVLRRQRDHQRQSQGRRNKTWGFFKTWASHWISI